MRLDPGAGSFSDARLKSNGAHLLNCHIVPRVEVEGNPGSYWVQGSAGLEQVADTVAGPCDGLSIWKKELYGVFGGRFFRVLPAVQDLGAIPGTGLCEFSRSRVGLVILRDNVTHLWNGTSLVLYIVPSGGAGEKVFSVATLDGYTIYSIEDSDKSYASDPLNPTVINALNFATAEARPDDIVRVMINNQSIWMMGDETIEIHYNAGQQGYPFLRYQNAMMDKGLLAKFSAISLHDQVIFLATDGKVYRGTGLDAVPISLPWLEEVFELVDRTDLVNSYAIAYTAGGTDFYALTIPNFGTYEFNDRSRLWSHRASPGMSNWSARGWDFEKEGGYFVGSSVDGKVYRVDALSTKEGSTHMEYELVTPPFGPKETPTSLYYVDMHIAALQGDPATATFQLDYTDDEGRTFSGLRTVPFPVINQKRAIVRQLGRMRRRQLRWRYSGDVQWRIEDMYIDMAAGWPKQGRYRPEGGGLIPQPQQG